MHFLQVAVRDPNYPRNRSLREALSCRGHCVTYVEVDPSGPYLRRCVRLLRDGFSVRHTDVVVLAELGVQYFWVSWLISRRHRAYHWVDWFVGMYETNVGDWGETSAWSPRSAAYRLFDRLAVCSADFLTTDTEPRSKQISTRRHTAQVLPVGAPGWGIPEDERPPRPPEPFRILFYGQLSPLHGIDTIVAALEMLREEGVDLVADLVLAGSMRHRVIERINQANLADIVCVRDSLPLSRLQAMVAGSHVVLGVFGTSTKAATVIPNKVWQGLLSGRPVVTRASPAYDAWRNLAGPLLIEVPEPLTPGVLAASLRQLARSYPDVVSTDLAARDLQRAFDDAFARTLATAEHACAQT